jgi:hypothetical protein
MLVFVLHNVYDVCVDSVKCKVKQNATGNFAEISRAYTAEATEDCFHPYIRTDVTSATSVSNTGTSVAETFERSQAGKVKQKENASLCFCLRKVISEKSRGVPRTGCRDSRSVRITKNVQ